MPAGKDEEGGVGSFLPVGMHEGLFEAEPFDIWSPTMRSRHSGTVATLELVRDLKTALPHGQALPARANVHKVSNCNHPLEKVY